MFLVKVHSTVFYKRCKFELFTYTQIFSSSHTVISLHTGLSISLFLAACSLWLGSAFRSWSTALDPLCIGTVDVMRRDPTLVISFGARSYRWSIGSHDRDLVSRVDLLRASGGPRSPFAPFSSATFLREQSTDPSTVDEVTSTAKTSKQNQIEKYTTQPIMSDR